MIRYAKMTARVEQYLIYRRSLGYDMRSSGYNLLRFAQYADRTGYHGPLTEELALTWARLPRNASPQYWAKRLEILRGFAKYEAIHDPKTEVPSRWLLGSIRRRTSPFIYSEAEITELLAVAGTLKPVDGLRPRTYQTLFGLLACTGLRVSEALQLARRDVDLQQGLLTIRQTKFHKSRLVPLHRSAVQALRRYSQCRDGVYPGSSCPAFFLAPRNGEFLPGSTVRDTFCLLRRKLGWHTDRAHRTPRIHDLRHTFACRRLLQWYQEGADVQRHITALSTYLGHVNVTSTYWYLTGTPELLAIAAARFEQSVRSGQGGLS